jgi:hypothetical protein
MLLLNKAVSKLTLLAAYIPTNTRFNNRSPRLIDASSDRK